MIRAASLALLLASSALIMAAAAKPADITGAWSFVTKPFGDACVASGSMVIADKHGVIACTFTTRERCGQRIYDARQTCTVTRTADNLSMVSTLQSVAPTNPNYKPDDFELKIESSAHMTGVLSSASSTIPVEFHRGDAPVS